MEFLIGLDSHLHVRIALATETRHAFSCHVLVFCLGHTTWNLKQRSSVLVQVFSKNWILLNKFFCFEFIAYLRRAIAHQGQGLNKEAKEDLSQVLAIEPNNKRAKVHIFYEIFILFKVAITLEVYNINYWQVAVITGLYIYTLHNLSFQNSYWPRHKQVVYCFPPPPPSEISVTFLGLCGFILRSNNNSLVILFR